MASPGATYPRTAPALYHGRDPGRNLGSPWAREEWSALAANQAVPPDPASSPWLAIAAPVGKIATYLLVGACFLQLFAPLAFLSNFRDRADPNGPGGPLILFLSDPVRLLALGDFVSILGIVILACAVFLILFGLIRADKRVRIDAFLLGLLVFACLVAWIPVMA